MLLGELLKDVADITSTKNIPLSAIFLPGMFRNSRRE
jgi:hypothetical protein